MTRNQFLKISIWVTSCVTLLLGFVLLYQYLHNGIPTHHFLARKDMPLVSNGWGLLTIPVFTWAMLWRINRRLFNNDNAIEWPSKVVASFVISLIFAIALGLSIQLGFKTFTGNVPLILFILALFFPTYRAEYFLGFVLGLTYFVGGVLPIVVGSVFLLLSAITHLYARTFLLWIFNWVRKSSN